MKKIFIVLLFILLGSSLIVVNNIKGTTKNSFNVVYENNKNIALPDLIGKQEIIDGLYRLYSINNITLDYNKYNGIYSLNGVLSSEVLLYLFTIIPNQQYTNTYIYISGSFTGNNQSIIYRNPNLTGLTITTTNYTAKQNNTLSLTTQNQYLIYLRNGSVFNDYQFKLQLEKGSTATPYVVSKIIPMYQDNLSMEEKQKIGLGAFGGITKIIKTINDIIKPVGDFINGLLSWF